MKLIIIFSAGIGRTGTLIAIFNLCYSMKLFKDNNNSTDKLLPFFSVFNVVRKLREQRFGMVTDYSQYTYIYKFLSEWILRNFDN